MSERIKVHIKSNGTNIGTFITDQDGRLLMFKSISFKMNAETRYATILLEIEDFELDIEAEAETVPITP